MFVFCGIFVVSAQVAANAYKMMGSKNLLLVDARALVIFVGTSIYVCLPQEWSCTVIVTWKERPKIIVQIHMGIHQVTFWVGWICCKSCFYPLNNYTLTLTLTSTKDCIWKQENCRCREWLPTICWWNRLLHCKGMGHLYWYEIGLNIKSGDICWWQEPHAPGTWNDIIIFRDVLAKHLESGERCETDKGYHGSAPQYVKCPGRVEGDDEKEAMQARVRNCQETVNKRFKNWGILVTP